MEHRLKPYRYVWPETDLSALPVWRLVENAGAYVRDMPESRQELARDSRWPAFFPSPLCLVTTSSQGEVGLEKVVGASIVNRFPHVMALSFCRESLSDRHHVRSVFTQMLEDGGCVAVQFLPPGAPTESAMGAISRVPEHRTRERIAYSDLGTRKAVTSDAPVFDAAYMVYEARLVRPGKDFCGNPIHTAPWIDVGSHRVYFLEIDTIQLRKDIADGRNQILWRSLPSWTPQLPSRVQIPAIDGFPAADVYQKGFTPHYAFPSVGTVAFEADREEHGMAIKHLPPLPEDQVEVDNDRARWPCFFPSSAGMITSWAGEGIPDVMPCGSTTVVSRHPMVIATCVAYAAINARYAPRASLESIRRTGWFGCGVPFIHDAVVGAIKYAGTVSILRDPEKVARSGLDVEEGDGAPVLPSLPVHFDCKVVGEVPLGTHVMFLGEVKRIRVRADVTPDNPLEWYPWAGVGLQAS